MPSSLEDHALTAAGNGGIGKTNATTKEEYNNDKEDDSFLDEVEESLLGDSTRPGPGSFLNGNRTGDSSGSPTLFSASVGNSPRHEKTLSSAIQSLSQETPLDDPASFRRKFRAALFYLLCSTLHEGVIYKIAQRTTWSNATLFIPLELLISTLLAGLLTIYMKITSNLKLQHAIGINGLPILPSYSWKESTPLAGLTVAAAVLRILKDAYLEASISTAVSVSLSLHLPLSTMDLTIHPVLSFPFSIVYQQTYVAPALCVILPLIYLSNELPRNGFLILASITIPTLYGLAITDLHVLSSAITFAMLFVFVEAGKLAFAKRWFLSKGGSPLEVIIQYLPVSCLFY